MIMRSILLGLLTFLLSILAAYFLRLVTGWFVPVPVWGMVILFSFFLVLGRVPVGVRLVGTFILNNMPLFFVPPTLGILALGALLRADGFGIGVAVIVSTLLGFVVTAGVFSLLNKAQDQ